MAIRKINPNTNQREINLYEIGANNKRYFLPDIMEQFIRYKKASNLRERTIDDYRKYFQEFLKVVPSETVNYDQLKDSILVYLTSKSGKAPATYNIPYSNLNALFNWMVEVECILPTNPIKQLKLKKMRDDGRVREIKADDLKKFMSYMDLQTYTGFRDYTFLVLTMDTGLRPNETCQLTENLFNFKDRTVFLPRAITKGRKDRYSPLTAQTVELISKLISFKDPTWSSLVFHGYDGEPFSTKQWIKRMWGYSRKSGVKITPYDLRHTFAIMFLRNNGNLFALQDILGHSDLLMTKRYCKLAQSDLENQHSLASPVASIIKRTTRVRKLFK